MNTTPGHPASLTPVTVLGLGPMGRALAGAFVDRGHPTTIWNRSAGKVGDLVERGATLATTPADAVRNSPLVIVCVIDGNAVEDIVGRTGGALAGRTLVNLTTDTPERERSLATWADEQGISYVDGSIMTPTTTIGGPDAVVLYSGSSDIYEANRDTLAAIGGTATYLGPDPGRAAAHDVALLDLFWTAMSGIVHAFALARTEGIAATDLVPYASGIAQLLPPILEELAEHVDASKYPGDDSNLHSALAGISHIVDAATSRGLDTSVLGAARSLAQQAVDAGHGQDAFSRLTDLLIRAA